MNNPYQVPQAELATESGDVEYVGFWMRVAASLVDTILMMMIIYPVLLAVYGGSYLTKTTLTAGPVDILMSYIFPAIAVLVFWVYKSATPGKMAVSAVIVDAKTLGKPSAGQLVLRYLCYYVSAIPLLLGIFWVGWDKRKQGWHDKIAGTVVIRKRG
ncbi:MAG: RDD family protein [Gammaproteobacteria bacterium]|jgi:uncharacterized RDD family membrane protein YckC|nr:RDD family protein [Gammaproteobacteria bacterium]MBQ0775711.1 RDD family protein [Gammaproteobacteria bacterium]|tara:strand:+ start:89764 stop:90234 length:471 start_codon:yes stop_codon:yes gene_type:complete